MLDDEQHVDRALALREAGLRGEVDMAAPSLWSYEVTNGLATAVRAQRIPRDTADQMLEALLGLRVRLVEVDPFDVWRTAMDLRVSAYDAAYVSLARGLECLCWTADVPLLRSRGAREWVRSIADFPGGR